MKKLFQFLDNQLLKIGVLFTIVFTALYPKLPSIQVTHTWVYIRLEDFVISAVVLIWIIQLLRKKVTLPWPISLPIFLYWFVGLLSLIYSIIFIGPHLAGFFPKIAAFEYFRRIEYMILFFVGFSTIRTKKDVKDYLVILGVTLAGILLYAFGQKYYLAIWTIDPNFARKFPFCFPSFQTGNEEFAKGIPLCLPSDARITSTFGGHYDLAAYLVLVIPIMIATCIMAKKTSIRILTGILSFGAIMILNFTASRISFAAYLIGVIFTLIFLKRKKYIIPVLLISVMLLVIFSGSLAKRFLETIRFTSLVTNNQGQVIGEVPSNLPSDLQNKITKGSALEENVPTQNLPKGTLTTVLPSGQTPVATNEAVVSKSLTAEQIKEAKLKNGGVEISTVSGSFLIQKALVYDISFTTRFQGEWPHAWGAFLSNPPLGTGYSSITLATDNDYLRFLGESGFLGLTSYLFIFILFGIYIKETAPMIKNTLERGLIFGLVGGVIGLFINATLIDVFEASKVAEPLWIFLGIGAGTIFLYPTKTINYIGNLQKLLKSKVSISIYLLIITLVFFLSGINNFFVSTDFSILKSAASSTMSTIGKSFIHTTGYVYHPLEQVTIFFLFTFFSFYPQGYHLFILLLHFLMAVGVYLLALRLFKKRLPSFLGAVLFLLLPAHQENVFGLSAVAIDLASVLMLFSIISYVKFRNVNTWYSYIASIALAFVGLLAHEMAVMLPFLIILSEFFVPMQVKKKIRNFIYTVPYLLVVLFYLVFRYFTHTSTNQDVHSYISSIIPNFFGYIALFIFGQLHNLTIQIYGGVLFFIAVAIVWFIVRKQNSIGSKKVIHYPLIFGLVFLLITLLPFLNFPAVAAQFGYLASVGFIILIIYILYIVEINITRYSRYVGQAVVIIGTICLSYFFAHQIQAVDQEWNTAGNITYKVLSEFRIDYDDIPKYSGLYFVDVPDTIDTVPVFDKGLQDGLWFIYRDPTLQINTISSIEEAKRKQAQVQRSSPQKTYIFRLDDKGDVEEIK